MAIFGALGRDNIAKKQVHILGTEGIVTDLLYFTEDAPSGRAYIVVDPKGRNFILTHRQANDLLCEKVIYSKNVHRYINNSNLIIVVDPPFSVADKNLVTFKNNEEDKFMGSMSLIPQRYQGTSNRNKEY